MTPTNPTLPLDLKAIELMDQTRSSFQERTAVELTLAKMSQTILEKILEFNCRNYRSRSLSRTDGSCRRRSASLWVPHGAQTAILFSELYADTRTARSIAISSPSRTTQFSVASPSTRTAREKNRTEPISRTRNGQSKDKSTTPNVESNSTSMDPIDLEIIKKINLVNETAMKSLEMLENIRSSRQREREQSMAKRAEEERKLETDKVSIDEEEKKDNEMWKTDSSTAPIPQFSLPFDPNVLTEVVVTSSEGMNEMERVDSTKTCPISPVRVTEEVKRGQEGIPSGRDRGRQKNRSKKRNDKRKQRDVNAEKKSTKSDSDSGRSESRSVSGPLSTERKTIEARSEHELAVSPPVTHQLSPIGGKRRGGEGGEEKKENEVWEQPVG